MPKKTQKNMVIPESVKTHTLQFGKVTRESFGKIKRTIDIPYLIEVQKSSYENFIKTGLKEVLEDFSPVMDTSENKFKLEFLDTKIVHESKYSEKECKERDATYSFFLYVNVRLTNIGSGEVTEQEVFFGEYPEMTDTGTFIINGAERVVVSQLIRSPGVYSAEKTLDKNGIERYMTQVIPVRGAWLEFIQEPSNTIAVRVDRKKKINATLFLQALGIAFEKDMGKIFGNDPIILATCEKDARDIRELRDQMISKDMNPATANVEAAKKVAYIKLKPGENPLQNSVDNHLLSMLFERRRYDLTRVGRYMFNKHTSLARRLEGRVLAEDIISEGELIASKGELVSLDKAIEIQNSGVNSVWVKLKPDFKDGVKPKDALGHNAVILSEYWKERFSHEIDESKISVNGYIYKPFIDEFINANLKLSEKQLIDLLKTEISNFVIPSDKVLIVGNNTVDLSAFYKFYTGKDLGFNPEEIGIKEKVHLPALKELIDTHKGAKGIELKAAIQATEPKLVVRHITIDDIIATISSNLVMRMEFREVDNIDHLSNRRVRAVGELLQNQFRTGLTRLERSIKERMNSPAADEMKPLGLINIKPVQSAIREFFGSSQLSQFMDQPNPIAELTHKRKLSALGPGGLNRERAGFEVRDVHHSHYGRMCPVETPEGQNIGLITSLSSFAKINEYGFIETPYRKVDPKTGVVTDQVVYLDADEEDRYKIAQANEELDEKQRFVKERVTCRYRDLIREFPKEEVSYMDVSPQQLVSIATSLIPFLENDDANRALMGSNMQRQAVPLLKPEAPIVGTGIEHKVAYDSGVCIIAKEAGTVSYVSADLIEITTSKGVDKYPLQKFVRSNQGTCINQKPIVTKGQKVQTGEIIADGPSTDKGELALGRNILIGFMPWEGYNYEDAILISEELVRKDVFTSIHIEEYEIECRDLKEKIGQEEITRDIPYVSDELIANLDEDGIIVVGSQVKPGDYLVGKVTPKGESDPSPEEKLLKSIFGDKTKDVRDVSLKVPNGEGGTVVGVRVFTRENKDELDPGVNKMVRIYLAQKRKIGVGDKMAGRHGNKGVISRVLPKEDMPFLEDGTPLQIVLNPLGVPSRMNIGQVLEVHLGYVCSMLGINVATPVFDGAKEEDIKELFLANGLYHQDAKGKKFVDGKVKVYDGRTGEPFENNVTVGYMYMLKLIHLVDDKIHARSVGPYSLVTQQPLGGKAQFGGQRFGEMEVWALEAYGASHILQEILTVKSDDVAGRQNLYTSIVKSGRSAEPGVPESFKVLKKEMQSLGIDVRLLSQGAEEVATFEDYEEIDVVPLTHSTEPSDEVGEFDTFDLEEVLGDLPDIEGMQTIDEAMTDFSDVLGDDDTDLDELFGDSLLDDDIDTDLSKIDDSSILLKDTEAVLQKAFDEDLLEDFEDILKSDKENNDNKED